jgi:hypothetical protein
MKKISWLTIVTVLITSCKLQPETDRSYDNTDKLYKLQLKPSPGSVYKYEIKNETGMNIEAEGEEVNSLNKSTVELKYAVAEDSSGNYVFTTTYDKIKIYTKNGDKETEMNSDNAMVTIDPVERMLGILKSAKIIASLNAKGEIVNVSGYKELGDQLMNSFATDDHYGKEMARHQWEKTIGNGIVKNTMDQLFKVFPDSAIHIGDTWKIDSRQEGELPMITKSIYTLKAINDDVAVIAAEGIINSDGTNTVMGYNNATASLKGNQTAEFEIETKTGMLINGSIKMTVNGKLFVMGREVPIEIESSVKMKGIKQ